MEMGKYGNIPLETAYTSPEITMITGMTYRQLDHCISTGLVTPSVDAGEGSGHRRLFGAGDVALLRVVTALRAMGVRGQTMSDAIDAVKRHNHADSTGFLVLPTNDEPFVGPVEEAVKYEACCVVNLSAVFGIDG